MYSPKQVARFWAKVTVLGEDDCWPWRNGDNVKGYGQVNMAGRRRPSHVVAWEIANNQPMPEGMHGCHSCDYPPCCNPKHVFAGTPKNNKHDSMAKGRDAHGARHGRAKLSAARVIEIRAEHLAGNIRQVDLARKHNVSTTTISRIILGKRWHRATSGETL